MPITSPGQVVSGVSPAVVNADGSFTMTRA